MKRTLKTIISMFLLTSMLVLSLAACNADSNNNANDGANGQGDITDSVTDVITSVEDTLNMNVNYDDYKFRVLTAAKGSRCPVDFEYSDKLDENILDEAIYKREALFADTYGVIIVNQKDLGTNNMGAENLIRDYTSDENSYDLCIIDGYDCSELTLQGALYDMAKLPNVNLKNTWWDQAATRDLSISGSLYYTTGAISTVIDDYTYCVIFNKDFYKATIGNQINVYDIVNEGKWTLDQLATFAKQEGVTVDNGDMVWNSQDRYGLMTWDNELIASINASGEKIATINEEGTVELTFYNDKVNAVIDKFVTIGNANYCINFQHMTGGVQWHDMFSQNQVLFFMTMFNEISRFRDMRTDYGILPNPKYSEDDAYYAPISPWHSAFICVPSGIKNADDISNIIELLGYHSEKLITPAYYDKTLVGKYTRDDESVEMLDLIFSHRIYDVGHLYRIATLQEHLTNLLRNNQPGGLSVVYQTYVNTANSDITNLNFEIKIMQSRGE